MHHLVVQILELKLLGTGADVALSVPVPFLSAVDRREQHVAANIEFPFLIE